MDNDDKDELVFYFDKYWELLVEKDKTIIFMIQLMIALLVIASFSTQIVPPTSVPTIKILIIFLLSITPVMLIDYKLKLNSGLRSFEKKLSISNIISKKWYKHLLDGTNYLYTLIVLIVIDIVIGVIVQNFQSTLVIILIQLIAIAIIIFAKRLIK